MTSAVGSGVVCWTRKVVPDWKWLRLGSPFWGSAKAWKLMVVGYEINCIDPLSETSITSEVLFAFDEMNS